MVKKKIVRTLSVVVLLMSMTMTVFADNQNGSQSLSEQMKNKNQKISVSIDPTIVEKLDKKDISDIVKEQPDSAKIEIVDESNLKQSDLENSSDNELYVYSNGKMIRFEIEKSCANKLSVQEAKEMMDDDDSYSIHVYDVGTDENLSNMKSTVALQAVTGYYVRTGAAKKSGGQYIRKDVFAGSVAKGETKKITYSGSLSFSVVSASGTYYEKSGLKKGLKAQVSCSISRTLDSKNMKKGCNSREFRIKYYAQKYTRSQQKIDAKRGTPIGKKRTATVSEPTKYASYSKDTKK